MKDTTITPNNVINMKNSAALATVLIALGLAQSASASTHSDLVRLENLDKVESYTLKADGSIDILLTSGETISLPAEEIVVAADGSVSIAASAAEAIAATAATGGMAALGGAGALGAAGVLLAAAALGGGGSSQQTNTTSSGSVVKGKWEGASVFYVDNIDTTDIEEPTGTEGEDYVLTDSSGDFSGLTYQATTNGAIIALATADTIDVSTGSSVPAGTYMSAPTGSTVVTMGTTLLVETDLTQAEINTVLGLDEDTDLTTFDPFETTDTASAVNLEAKSQQILTAITVTKSALEGAGASGSDALKAATKAVASQIAAKAEASPDAEIALNDGDLIENILEAASTDEALLSSLADTSAQQTLKATITASKTALVATIESVANDIETKLTAVETDLTNDVAVEVADVISGEVLDSVTSLSQTTESVKASTGEVKTAVAAIVEQQGDDVTDEAINEAVALDADVTTKTAAIETEVEAIVNNPAPVISLSTTADEANGEKILYNGVKDGVAVATINPSDESAAGADDAPTVSLVGEHKDIFTLSGNTISIADAEAFNALSIVSLSVKATDSEGKVVTETLRFTMNDIGEGEVYVGSSIGALDSISAAAQIASSGDTIYVGAGTFEEDFTLNAGVSLEGAQSGSNVAMNPTSGDPNANLTKDVRGAETEITGTITVAGDNVSIDGIYLTNPSGAPIDFSGNEIAGFALSNSYILHYPAGTFSNGDSIATNWSISNNFIGGVSTVDGNGGSLYLNNLSDSDISGNVFWRPGAAHLYGDNWEQVSVDGNNFYHGLHAGTADFDGNLEALADILGSGYGYGYGSGYGYGDEGSQSSADYYGRNYWMELSGDVSAVSISNNSGKYNSGGIQLNGEDFTSAFTDILIENNTFSDFINADPTGTVLDATDDSRHDSGFMGTIAIASGDTSGSPGNTSDAAQALVIRNNEISIDRSQVDLDFSDDTNGDVAFAIAVAGASEDVAIVGNTISWTGDNDLNGNSTAPTADNTSDLPGNAIGIFVEADGIIGDFYVGSNTITGANIGTANVSGTFDTPIDAQSDSAALYGKDNSFSGDFEIILWSEDQSLITQIDETSVNIDQDFLNYAGSLIELGQEMTVAVVDMNGNTGISTISGTSTLDSATLSSAFSSGSLNNIGATIEDGVVTLAQDALFFIDETSLASDVASVGVTGIEGSATVITNGLQVTEISDTSDPADGILDELIALSSDTLS